MFWSEAIATACHIRNRCPTSSLGGGGRIPYEKWRGKLPGIHHLRIFGSRVMILDKDPSKDKLAPRAVEGIFVGYPRDRKGYRVWLPIKRQIVHARDIKFMEEIGVRLKNECKTDESLIFTEVNSEIDRDYPGVVEFFPPQIERNVEQRDQFVEPIIEAPADYRLVRAPGRPKLVRTGSRGRPKKLFHTREVTPEEDTNVEDTIEEINAEEDEDDTLACVAEIDIKSALKGEEGDEWMEAMESEVISLLKNDTFDIIRRNDDTNIVGCRMVLTNKHGSDGKIVRRKARLVAKGYSQKFGINYHQTFAPVAR